MRLVSTVFAFVVLALSLGTSANPQKPKPWRAIAAALVFACLALGCGAPTGPYAALSTTGSRMDDGGGECGAVALDSTHALTAAHCARESTLYYHAPGSSEGTRVQAVSIGSRDFACLRVKTERTDAAALGELYADAVLRLDGNVSGETAGVAGESWDVSLTSQRGDSGSAVRDKSGAIVGLVSKGMDPVNGHATITRIESTIEAAKLCAEM
jgi:hypothetical protein